MRSFSGFIKSMLGIKPKPVKEGSFDRMIRMLKETNSTMTDSLSMLHETNKIMDSTTYLIKNFNRIKERIDDIADYGKTEAFKQLCVNEPAKALGIIKEMNDLIEELENLSFDKS